MNEDIILVLDKNEKDITRNVEEIRAFDVKVKYGEKIYKYDILNVKIFLNPIDLGNCLLTTSKTKLFNVKKVLKFDNYIKVFFNNNTNRIYNESKIKVEQDLLSNNKIKSIFNYFKEMAANLKISDLVYLEEKGKDERSSEFLSNVYKKIDFINEGSVVKNLINGCKSFDCSLNLKNIYPFSFNLSQQLAIENAFSNNITVIEGPPGTGKTQTILNIIANAIINGKTVAVLSNNNSATDNVFEKLEKHGLGSLCAKLGKSSNVKKFLAKQSDRSVYPASWLLSEGQVLKISEYLLSINNDIKQYLLIKNKIATLKQELDDLITEQKYFESSVDVSNIQKINLPNLNSLKFHELLLYLNKQKNKKDFFNKRVQYFSQIKFKFLNYNLYEYKINEILDAIEFRYYEKRIDELKNTIKLHENNIKNCEYEKLFHTYSEESMKIFKNFVYLNYNNKKLYDQKSIKNTELLIKDYPIILSTTYSLLNCVSQHFMFDYMIIDESSQVDLISSFPALTRARNVIIVGDSKQLPNIVDSSILDKFNEIFKKYNIEEKYNYTCNSLLDLAKNVQDLVDPVILKEHYRCHPKIINFCNKMFYDNKLIILTNSNTSDPIKHYKCVKGNHARKLNNSQYNDRQAQVIKDEVIPQQNINIYENSVGIITPYKEQKKYLIDLFQCNNLAIDTVHGFQGREKDTIIFSTVANNITKFLDNPNSINVAISRAVNKLILVTPFHYEFKANSSISNLISYINYNNFEIVESNINSIFDLLYKVNEKEKNKYLNSHIIFSMYPSETLMYNTIKGILQNDKYNSFSVKDRVYPLRKIVNDKSILTEDEIKFINRNSHIDFLIFNKFNKLPILAIEVDGFYWHNRKEQKIRDQKKDNILRKCNIPLLRFNTNECKETEKIIRKLDEILDKI